MQIKILPKELAAKIAAGEVIERAVSVVKELVENAVDAQATEISVVIEDAGKKLIQVVDNGQGIDADEVRLALQRYATSKIASFDDLGNVKTLGFRGEALASIAAVSMLTIETKSKTSTEGSFLSMEGGDEKEWKLTAVNTGTSVRVENLFFNVPARLKFVKSDLTEKRRIFDMMIRYALYYANIRFKLEFDKRTIFSTNGNGDRREILSQIFNLETAKNLLEVDTEIDNFKISGFISPLDLTRSNRKDIFLFVNGRLISDVSLASAITRAYQGLIMVGRYPIAILFLKIEPTEIDVNVHPAKAEVRFRNPGQVFSAVNRAVRRTITALSPIHDFPVKIWGNQNTRATIIDPGWQFAEGQAYSGLETDNGNQSDDFRESPGAPGGLLANVPILRPIGQLGRTYIACEGPDGLYLIDQHAAHERVLYEKMLQPITDSNKQSNSQYLLDPVSIQLTPFESEELEKTLGTLSDLGFDIVDFGPNIFQVRAVPVLIQNMDPRGIIIDILAQDSEEDLLSSQEKNRLISKICKQAAVKGGQILSKEEQEQLIYDLEKCEMPRTCPHGRPTMIHISVDVLEKEFGRKGSI